jgi:LysR family transcriptional regulator for bpeEF and oprC
VNYFSTRTGRPYPHVFEREGASQEISGRYRLSLNEANAHMAAVLAGLGVSQVALFAAADHLAKGELVRVLEDWDRPPIPLHVVYPPNRHLSAKVRAFVEWAAELFAKNPHVQI